ncbi:serine/threonine protein kinase [Thraustotheca clavata]|uniref:Serine/threonine protein kinase n=1 Tax=Thraustotheca clavata TaxID=74557 RepID=A0A1V9ZZR3_9STRA|nr:serine/threonine protein kinase [Thraustotheca clavata]
MLRAIDMVHKANFLHGDIKPDNWILLGSCPNPFQVAKADGISIATSELCLIDFGRSIDRTMYPQGTCFLNDCHAKGFQCIEMLTNKPWTCQVDTFGVAAIAYFMLFGEYLFKKHLKQVNGRWSLNRPWKRYWRSDLWTLLFDVLLNVSSCSKQPDILCLVNQLESYYTDDISKVKELHELLRSQDRMIPKSSI